MAFHVPGPCQIYWDEELLGFTKAGIIIRPVATWEPILDDEHGAAPADFIQTGKSCVVETILLHPSDYAGVASLFAMTLLDASDTAGANLVGSYAGPGGNDDIYKALTIVEANGATWTADFAVSGDPREIRLMSTQELGLPMLFQIVPNAAGKLFSAVPSYIT